VSRASAHQILHFEVVLLQDHCKTPWLPDRQGATTTAGLRVIRVLLAVVGNVKDLDVYL